MQFPTICAILQESGTNDGWDPDYASANLQPYAPTNNLLTPQQLALITDDRTDVEYTDPSSGRLPGDDDGEIIPKTRKVKLGLRDRAKLLLNIKRKQPNKVVIT